MKNFVAHERGENVTVVETSCRENCSLAFKAGACVGRVRVKIPAHERGDNVAIVETSRRENCLVTF